MALAKSVLSEIKAIQPAKTERERLVQYHQAVRQLGPTVRQQATDELVRQLAERLRL